MKITRLIASGALAMTITSFAQVPVITTQPQSQQVLAGDSVTLNVAATSATLLSYQWVANGRTVVGQTNASLGFNNVQVSNTASYYVIVKNASGPTNSAIARLEVNVASAPSTPLALNGWDVDAVLENAASRSSQGLDPTGASWFEAGLDGHADGLPSSRGFTSVSHTNVIFVLQPYATNNILALSSFGQNTGTLTLEKPTAYKSLSILATSGNGGGNGALVLTFSDGTIVSNLTFSARDWYDKTTNLAIAGLGRDQFAGPQLDYQNATTGFGMFETDINLAAAGLANKLLQSLAFTKPGQSWVTAVFAVSGERTEPPLRITYPLDGQAFILPTNMIITAEASFPFTTVTNVEFFQGTTRLGAVSSEPFSWPWTGFGAGTYSLSIRATDDQGTSKTSDAVTVIIYPTTALFAVDDAYSIAEDNTLSVPAPGLLANDRNVTASTVVSLVSGPRKGILWFNPDGSFVYTPGANYNGIDSFVYRVQDGTYIGNTGTVSIAVTPVNDAPVAESQSITLAEDTETNFFVRATDVDGNPLTYTIVTFPAHGHLLLGATNFPTLNLTYIPDANYNGPDSFTFKANDGQLDSNPGTVSLTILSVEDPPVSQDDSYTVPENNTLTVSAEDGVLSNDTEGDGQPMAVTLVSGTTHGMLSLNGDGSFTYAPDTNFDGVDSFAYQANDGVTNGNSATVKIAVGDEKWDDRIGYSGFNQPLTALTSDTNGNLYVGGLFNKLFFSGQGINANGVAKWDGQRWSTLGVGPSNGVYNGYVYAVAAVGNQLYVGGDLYEAGGVKVRGVAKWDGSRWNAVGGIDGIVYALAVKGDELYVGGQFTDVSKQGITNFAKWDGTNWFSVGGGVDNTVRAIAVSDMGDIFVGGDFSSAGGIAASHLARWDGVNWTTLGTGVNGEVDALAWGAGGLYAGGNFSTAGGIAATNVARWDGAQWIALGSGIQGGKVLSLTGVGTNLYAGGRFTGAGSVAVGKVARWDGQTWSPLSAGIGGISNPNLGVNALLTVKNSIVAAGYFATAGGLTVDSIARWDGQTWFALNKALVGGPVMAIATAGTNIYVGGGFTLAGGLSVKRIARWDGAQWSALGSGTNDGVDQSLRALAVTPGETVYAGGDFTQAGGQSANHIAKWDGQAWSALGAGSSNGLDGVVYAVAVSGNGDVYAGGRFSNAGGLPAKSIARWNGTNWSAVGDGVDGWVFALAFSGSDLYAAGAFPTASGVTVNNVGRWDGAQWTALGSGITSAGFSQTALVYSLAPRGAELFVGGDFSLGGGVAATNLARWNGSSWSAIAGSISKYASSSPIYALQVVGSDLYAGGLFSQFDNLSTTGVARWDGSTWSALGSGVNGQDTTVYALAQNGSNLWVGGYFTEAGGKSSERFGRWYLGNSAPSISITNPVPGSIFTVGDNITISAEAYDGDGTINRVEFFAGTNSLGTAFNAPYTVTWSNVFTGDYYVFASATDNTGSTSSSAPMLIRVRPPTNDVPPKVAFINPTNGATATAGQTIAITASASDADGTIRQVAFYQGNNLLQILPNSPYAVTWSNAFAGSYTFTAVAMDNFGATNAVTIQITLQHPPEVFVAVPSEGDRYTIPVNVRLAADAFDFEGPVSRVDFYTNGVFLATANVFSSPEFSFTWTNAPLGNYTLTAVAIDGFGAKTTSAPVHFSVETPNALPQVRILSPAAGAIYSAPTNIVVTVDASDPDGSIQQVQLYSYDFLLGTLTNQPFVFVVRNLTETTYCLNARALDNRGGIGVSSQVCVTVTNDPVRMPKYNIIDLGALVGPETRANGINNDGVVVGDGKTPDYRQRPFIYRNGSVQILPLLGGEGLGGGGGALAINDAGSITGYAADGSGYPRTFLYDGTNMVNLGTLGGRQSFGRAVNASGQIVGEAEDGNNQARAFLFSDGMMTNLDSFGGSESGARGINDSGQIVGAARLPSGKTRGFDYSPTTGMTTLGTLGGDNSQALAMNNSGQIVGDASTADGHTHAFLYLQGFMVDLGTFGGFNSIATGISGHGQIVGWAEDVHLRSHAFLWHNCVLYDLNQLIPPGSDWVLTQADAVNDSGQIVGFGKKGLVDQNDRAFLLTLAQDSPQRPEDNQLISFKNGHFNFCIPVPLGSPFVLEASTNLVNWVTVATNYNRSGLVDFTDPEAGGLSARFYRAVTVP